MLVFEIHCLDSGQNTALIHSRYKIYEDRGWEIDEVSPFLKKRKITEKSLLSVLGVVRMRRWILRARRWLHRSVQTLPLGSALWLFLLFMALFLPLCPNLQLS